MAGPRLLENFANAYGTTLAGNGGSITSGATSFNVLSGAGAPRAVATDVPPSGYRAIIDGDTPSANTEIVWVLGQSGTSVSSVIRAAESFPGGCAAGSPVAHNDGVPMRAIVTGKSMSRFARTPSMFGPGAYSLHAWNVDPWIGLGSVALTIGSPYAEAIPISEVFSVTNVVAMRMAAGTGLVSCFMGLYDGRGNQLGASANLATAWAAAVAGTPPYDEARALASGPFNTSPIHSDDWGWVVFLVGQGSTTSPTFANWGSNTASVHLSTGPRRSGYLTGLTAQTTLPASLTPANVDNTGHGFWVAIS